MNVQFTKEPITKSGIYIWKWEDGTMQLVTIFEDLEESGIFYITDYPNANDTLPIDDSQLEGTSWFLVEEFTTD